MSTEIQQVEAKVIRGMVAGLYHANGACSASKLKAMRRSPAHCRYQMDNPPASEAMALGSLLHTIILEPDATEQFYMMPECDRRTKEGKAIWADATAKAAGKTVIKREDFDLAYEMKAACTDHPAFVRLFDSNGHNELSIFWQDADTGLQCKMRADRVVEIPGFGQVCVDLKTTTDASARAFGMSVHKFGYAIQAAFYLHGLALAGIPCEKFVIMAVESAPPHCVAVYALDDDTMAQGHRDYRRLLGMYAGCVKSGEWPGYSSKIESLSLPRWALKDEEAANGEE